MMICLVVVGCFRCERDCFESSFVSVGVSVW